MAYLNYSHEILAFAFIAVLPVVLKVIGAFRHCACLDGIASARIQRRKKTFRGREKSHDAPTARPSETGQDEGLYTGRAASREDARGRCVRGGGRRARGSKSSSGDY